MATVLCPLHGLRFDPAVSDGCSRCRAPSATPPVSRRGVLAAAASIATVGAAALAYTRLGRSASPEIEYAPNRHGAIFVPDAESTRSPRPLILLFDPGGDAVGIVRRYSVAANRLGWLAASSREVVNGTADSDDTDNMMRLLDYVHAHHAVSDSQVFAGGVSGGACGAYRLAIVKSTVVHGAVVECGHMGSWREVGDFANASLRFYLFTREDDFNRPATRQLQAVMEAKGCRVSEVEKPGGHQGMNEAEVFEALSWMQRA